MMYNGRTTTVDGPINAAAAIVGDRTFATGCSDGPGDCFCKDQDRKSKQGMVNGSILNGRGE